MTRHCHPAATLMVQGTASSAGKSALVTGLCRFYAREGLRVAPFKSQNMALNAFVTAQGHEIGRAQAVQAEAAGCAIEVDMNPILIKPMGHTRSQTIVMGKPAGNVTAAQYHQHKADLRELVRDSLERLRERFDMVVIEGAGSPAEINLLEHELVNMFVAHLAQAPTLLVGDIDRGGVFAAFAGTLLLLPPRDRQRIVGCVINKFRGDRSLLEPGLAQIEAITGVPVMGVIPYSNALALPEEDSLGLDTRARSFNSTNCIRVFVLRTPAMSNYDDFAALEAEPSVEVAYGDDPQTLRLADLVILPGSKSTLADLDWLRTQGLDASIQAAALAGTLILGICGGCQMLGQRLDDPGAHESPQPRNNVPGLGLLGFFTTFQGNKTTRRVQAHSSTAQRWIEDPKATVVGYEIHCGHIEREATCAPAFMATASERPGHSYPEGAVSAAGNVLGTMIHGLLDGDELRAALLQTLARRRNLDLARVGSLPLAARRAQSFDWMADQVEAELGRDRLLEWARGRGPRRATRSFEGKAYTD